MCGSIMSAPPVERLGDALLIRGEAVTALALLAARGAKAVAREDGTRVGGVTAEVLTTLIAIARERPTAARGQMGRPPEHIATESYPDARGSTREVASLLGLSTRQTRRLANDLGARKIGRDYQWPLDVAQLYAAHRQQGG